MFRIYTKMGDKGQSSLADGSRVPKYHKRLEAYGTLDELLSNLGLLKSLLSENEKTKKDSSLKAITRVQNELFAMSSETAHPSYETAKNKSFLILEEQIKNLEKEVDNWESFLKPLRNFLIPGSHSLSSSAHVSRTICRRAERALVLLGEEEKIREELVKYVNRLSDWLFTLARYLDHLLEIEECLWES